MKTLTVVIKRYTRNKYEVRISCGVVISLSYDATRKLFGISDGDNAREWTSNLEVDQLPEIVK